MTLDNYWNIGRSGPVRLDRNLTALSGTLRMADHAHRAVEFVVGGERDAAEVVGDAGDVAGGVVVERGGAAGGVGAAFEPAVFGAVVIAAGDGVAVGVGDAARLAGQVEHAVDLVAFLVVGADRVVVGVVVDSSPVTKEPLKKPLHPGRSEAVASLL